MGAIYKPNSSNLVHVISSDYPIEECNDYKILIEVFLKKLLLADFFATDTIGEILRIKI